MCRKQGRTQLSSVTLELLKLQLFIFESAQNSVTSATSVIDFSHGM